MENLAQAIDTATALAAEGSIDEGSRIVVLEAATKLVTVLQKPEDAITKLTYWPSQFMCMRVLVELGVFNHIVEKGKVTSAELAETTKADKVLLANELTKVLATRGIAGLVEAIFDGGMNSLARMPDYFAQTGYKNPSEQNDGPVQFSSGIGNITFFDYMATKPKLLNSFQTFFEADLGSRPVWVDWFPVKEKLLDDATKPIIDDGILYVDVAGGRGHDLLAFIKKFPEYPGRYVIMDLPHVVNDTTLDLGDRVERKEFNFFEDKVAPDVRLYYMKFIMHDWSDEKCLIILKNITTSMKKGYSTLVIEDFIIPPKGCALLPAMWDMQMMAMLSAMERTENQWMELLGEAGLEIEGFFSPPGDGTGVIMTKLKD